MQQQAVATRHMVMVNGFGPGMLRFLKGSAALSAAVVSMLAGSFVAQRSVGAVEVDRKDARRTFYVTRTRHDGSAAATACAAGYHMASIWEILDPSSLRYETALGVTYADSGEGAPTNVNAWVRTGRGPSNLQIEGAANCRAWTSNSSGDYGTAVRLPGIWTPVETIRPIHPWSAVAGQCDLEAAVWCAQD